MIRFLLNFDFRCFQASSKSAVRCITGSVFQKLTSTYTGFFGFYGKTGLTLGDKSAPTMAQAALRKRTHEAKEAFPEAAKVFKDSAFMDAGAN